MKTQRVRSSFRLRSFARQARIQRDLTLALPQAQPVFPRFRRSPRDLRLATGALAVGSATAGSAAVGSGGGVRLSAGDSSRRACTRDLINPGASDHHHRSESQALSISECGPRDVRLRVRESIPCASKTAMIDSGLPVELLKRLVRHSRPAFPEHAGSSLITGGRPSFRRSPSPFRASFSHPALYPHFAVSPADAPWKLRGSLPGKSRGAWTAKSRQTHTVGKAPAKTLLPARGAAAARARPAGRPDTRVQRARSCASRRFPRRSRDWLDLGPRHVFIGEIGR